MQKTADTSAPRRNSVTLFARYREIALVLLRNGFGDLAAHAGFDKYLSAARRGPFRARQRDEPLTRARRLRRTLEELGPTFVKFGQALSVRADLLPAAYVDELTQLQDHVAPLAPGEAEAEIEQVFRTPVSSLFAEFEPVPIAAGSIAQVHRAVLSSGERVAVKVRRPGIGRVIESDLAVLAQLAHLADRHATDIELLQPEALVGEFARSIRREQDLAREGRIIERFSRAFSGNPTIRFPQVHWPLTRSGVLTLEFMEGVKVSALWTHDDLELDRRLVAQRGAAAMLEQVFVHGLFHGDPHPGNVLVLPQNVICLLDFGIVGRVDEDVRSRLLRLVSALGRRDADAVMEQVLVLATPLAEVDRHELRNDVDELIDSYADTSLRDIVFGEVMHRVLDAMTHHRLAFSPDLMLLIKALSTMEGVGRELDPDFKMLEFAAPMAERLILAQLAPGQIVTRAMSAGRDAVDGARSVLEDAAELLHKARTDRLQIQFVHRNFEHFVREMDRASNRLSFAIVIAALLVGSSVVIQSGTGPHAFGYPAIGVAGFLAAAVLGLGLIAGVLRSGRL